MIIGNVAATGLLYFDVNIYIIFLVNFFVTIVGTILSFFLWPYKNRNGKEDKSSDKKKKASRNAYQDIEMEDRNTPNVNEDDSMAKKIVKTAVSKSFGVLNTTKNSLIDTASVLIDRRMILLAPLCMYSGMTAGYFSGSSFFQ